eukprot:4434334-Pyramimonas_sp.AAC.1
MALPGHPRALFRSLAPSRGILGALSPPSIYALAGPRQACRRPGEALRGPGGLCEASDRVAGLCGGLSVERSTDTS